MDMDMDGSPALASALVLLAAIIALCVCAYASGINKTECSNQCLVRGFTSSEASGFFSEGDCQCMRPTVTITEGER
uniref:Uncharacterized protein n=1 Tax=viral metagenome TaxID=1070528 RepID=A0A6M3LFC2_9ZZZZ